MSKLAKQVLLLTIVLSSTQQIQIGSFPLSIFQVMILISFVVGILNIFMIRKIIGGRYLVYVFVGTITTIIAFIISTNIEWAKSYLLLGLMTSGLILLIVVNFNANDIDSLCLALIRSQYITIILSVYSVIMFYTGSGSVKDISIGPFLIELGDTFETVGQASGQIRLFAPYHTGPVLSVVMSMSIIILMFNRRLYSSKVRIILIIVFAMILLLTGSRTGIVGIVGLALIYALRALCRAKIHKKTVMFTFIGIFVTFLFLFSMKDLEFVAKLLKRFQIENLMEDRHFLVPLDGIIIWLGSIKNFFIGIGFGSSINIMGAHTFLPPYFLNNYVTLIVERGVLGLMMVLILLGVSIRGFQISINTVSEGIKATWMALLCGLIAGIFYECLNCYFVVIVLGIGFMLDTKNSVKIQNGKYARRTKN